MRKLFFQMLMLLISTAVFAQESDAYKKGYEFGRKYGLVIVIALIVIIVFVVMRVVNKRKNRS